MVFCLDQENMNKQKTQAVGHVKCEMFLGCGSGAGVSVIMF